MANGAPPYLTHPSEIDVVDMVGFRRWSLVYGALHFGLTVFGGGPLLEFPADRTNGWLLVLALFLWSMLTQVLTTIAVSKQQLPLRQHVARTLQDTGLLFVTLHAQTPEDVLLHSGLNFRDELGRLKLPFKTSAERLLFLIHWYQRLCRKAGVPYMPPAIARQRSAAFWLGLYGVVHLPFTVLCFILVQLLAIAGEHPVSLEMPDWIIVVWFYLLPLGMSYILFRVGDQSSMILGCAEALDMWIPTHKPRPGSRANNRDSAG